MKIRIKFTKTGPVRYIGHLDVMRYFQKLNKRANIDVKYSEGFSPHQIMSFAAPLGVGLQSLGEYVDIEVNETMASKDAINALNDKSTDGIKIVSYVRLNEGAANAMSSVAAADYIVKIRDNYDINVDNLKDKFKEFLSQKKILVMKASKKSTREVDLKPLIYDAYINDEGSFFMKLSTGSVENLKPELVLETFYKYLCLEFDEMALDICRLEVYGINSETNSYIPLEKFGEVIE